MITLNFDYSLETLLIKRQRKQFNFAYCYKTNMSGMD